MTINETRARVGQHLLVGFHGTRAVDAEALLEQLRPAGLVLVPRNIESAGQVADLVGGLQAAARRIGLPPLLIAVDQEGGSIARLDAAAGFTEAPSAMAVGATGDPGLARSLAEAIGREVAAVGVNLALAPVLDLALDPRNDVIGSRSFGSEPAEVARFGVAVVEGLHAAGVAACAKHFPGHGATAADSHLELPTLASDLAELRGRDLVPFRAAINAGCDTIMTAHVMSALDPARPATLSRPTLGGVLRQELGFEGPILTDALEMRALASVELPRPRSAVEALRAGADLLVFEGDRELIEAAAAAVGEALAAGELDEAAGAGSDLRLETVRQRLGSPRPSLDAIGSAAHASLALRAAQAGLRIDDDAGILPLRATPEVLDLTSGGDVAAALGWPGVERSAVTAGGRPLLVALDGGEIPTADRRLLAELARADRPLVAVVLEGWQVPAGVEATATVLAYDLPRSLWPAITTRLADPSALPTPTESGSSGATR